MPHPSSGPILGLAQGTPPHKEPGMILLTLSQAILSHVEQRKNIDSYTTAQLRVVLSFSNQVMFLFNRFLKISSFRSSYSKNNQPKKPQIQLSHISYQVLYYTKYFHVSVISFLAVLRNSATVGLEQLHGWHCRV